MNVGFASAWPGYAIVFAALVFATSGAGARVLQLRTATGMSFWRRMTGDYVVGVLLWSVAFGLCSEISAPLLIVAGVLGSVLLVGVLYILREARRTPSVLARRCAVAVVLGTIMLVAGLTPVNPGAADPLNYAYITATVFHGNWVAANLSSLPDGIYFADLAREGTVARSPAIALVWPASVLGWGLDAHSIAGVAAWLTLATFALLVDVWHGQAPLLARLLLAGGAIGSFNAMTVLTGGQVNQAFAIAVAVAAVWLFRWIEHLWTRRIVAVLAGAAVAASYPEFLAALPLYAACLLLVRDTSLREAIIAWCSLGAGIALVQLSSAFATTDYLLTKAGQAPAWWPLASDPHNVADEWIAIVGQRLPPRIVLLAILPGLWYAWTRTRATRSARPPWTLGVSLALFAGLAGVWSWLMTQAPNPNYATFKVAGWIGPGLVLLAWYLARSVPRALGKSLVTLVLTLALVRTLGLAAVVASSARDYVTSNMPTFNWGLEQTASGGCLVVLAPAPDPRTVLAAVAGSAGPSRACLIQPG